MSGQCFNEANGGRTIGPSGGGACLSFDVLMVVEVIDGQRIVRIMYRSKVPPNVVVSRSDLSETSSTTHLLVLLLY